MSTPLRVPLISGFVLSALLVAADACPARAETAPGAGAPSRSLDGELRTDWSSDGHAQSAQAARDLAFAYLRLWSAPNRVALASARSFYGPTVRFHGRTRTLGSVLAEKRRFAARWPNRAYRYRPETTQVACEAGGDRCTVWALFDFSAAHPRHGRRSRGLGEHELLIRLSDGRPVILAEHSRVLRRGTVR